jgi:hypothetical protein
MWLEERPQVAVTRLLATPINHEPPRRDYLLLCLQLIAIGAIPGRIVEIVARNLKIVWVAESRDRPGIPVGSEVAGIWVCGIPVATCVS